MLSSNEVFDDNSRSSVSARPAISAETPLTSPATTAKPRPASPTRALSMRAFSASILVRPVIDWISAIFSRLMRPTSSLRRTICSGSLDSDSLRFRATRSGTNGV